MKSTVCPMVPVNVTALFADDVGAARPTAVTRLPFTYIEIPSSCCTPEPPLKPPGLVRTHPAAQRLLPSV